jgi:hypothetical protein
MTAALIRQQAVVVPAGRAGGRKPRIGELHVLRVLRRARVVPGARGNETGFGLLQPCFDNHPSIARHPGVAPLWSVTDLVVRCLSGEDDKDPHLPCELETLSACGETEAAEQDLPGRIQ